MTNRELKPILSSVRNWLVELSDTLPQQFAVHVAVITGELTKRIKAEEQEKTSEVLDH